jgi:hypothetical protein
MDQKTFSNLSLGLKFSGLIIFPVLFSFFIGRYFVNRFDMQEYFLYIFIAFGVFISFYGLIKEIKQYVKKLEKEEKNNLNK